MELAKITAGQVIILFILILAGCASVKAGFIKAEAYTVDDLRQYGSEAGIKSAGKYRQEGKDYVVQDGDVLFFKFNV